MSFELSFSPEFFFNELEPTETEPSDRPTSVWQAIVSAQAEPKRWTWIAGWLEVDPEFLTPEAVLEAIEKTNACSNLNSPVEVWVEPTGWCRLSVYDSGTLSQQ